MKIRPDIAALVRDGHSDASIALRLGCDRSTVGKTRRALSQAAARRIDECQPRRMPTSPAQQAANRAALLAALRTPAA
ncbi:helix-turn-helix domain-containing protein [Streptomyces sp. NPDC059534]|uniref:helix-turn-helix domain-containing protein n=1 Tax=Streptomyces sp. NPDC059534 TaxID=3346859 RepID=UPI0036977793